MIKEICYIYCEDWLMTWTNQVIYCSDFGNVMDTSVWTRALLGDQFINSYNV